MFDDEKIRQYLSLDSTYFDVLDRLNFFQKEIQVDSYSNKYILSLEIWFSSGISDDLRRLRLWFNDIQQLRLEARGDPLIFSLVIRSLRKDQWEHLNYQVSSQEDQVISFYCREFEADIITVA